MELIYNWQAALATVFLIISIVVVGQFIVFRIPAIAKAQQADKEKNKQKWKQKSDKYRLRVPVSQKIGLSLNLVFYVAILPFLATLDPQPLTKIVLDVFLILMIYDFFYYFNA